MKKIIFILMTASFLIGHEKLSSRQESFEATMTVINIYTEKLKKEKSIRNSAYGLGYSGEDKIFDGKIHKITLAYSVDQNLKYNEARDYFYTIVDGLIAHINQNTHLKKYFFHYPIDYSDLDFHFSFEDDKEDPLKKDDVHSIHIVRNEIFYEIINEEGPCTMDMEQVSPDVYIMKGILEKNRSIIRPVSEDLAMHKNK